MIRYLRSLYQHRELLLMWTWREIKVRYKQSLLGSVWAVLQPLSLMVVFSVIFTYFVQVPTDGVPYPLFSYAALLPWTFFATSVGFAVPTLVNNMNLVTKIYFPREILPLASVGAAFVDFLVASSLFLLLLFWYHASLSWTLLWLPLLLVIQVVLVLGIVLPAAALNVFYRDVRFIIPLATQLLMYATPIIYPITVVPERFRPFYALNPMVGIIDSYRRVILYGELPSLQYLGSSIGVSVLLVVAGYMYFKRAEDTFADLI